jgi:hypothetical protein
LLVAASINLFCFAGISTAADQTKDEAKASRWTPLIPYCKTVMIIPLDSRPANTLYPSLICKIAGFEPMLPPAALMDNFQKPAAAEKIAEWMLSNADKADAFIISTTMLCYGGLVSSRTPEKHLYQALKNLKSIEELKRRNPDKPVFVYDIIQRLAVTASSEKDLEYYKLVRQWAILDEKIETAAEGDEIETHRALKSKIPPKVFDDYMKARKRNNAVNTKVIQMCRAGYIDYIVLGQDDASKYGIHKREARGLRDFARNIRLDGKFNIFPGADEIDAVFIARLASYFYGRKPKYFTLYPNDETIRWIAPYEDIEISENIKRHLEVSGADICTAAESADVILALNATAETEIKRAEDMVKIADRIAKFVKEGKLVAAADLSFANRSDTAFVELLTARADISELAAYSAWNTAGNKTGFALGQASARWHSLNLKRADIFTEKLKIYCARAHYELLMLRFLKDHSYKNFVMKAAEKYIEKAGADRFDLKNKKDEVQNFVSEALTPFAHKWFDSFKGKKMNIDASPNRSMTEAYITSLKDLKITLPWPRIFECEINFKFGLDIKTAK